MKESSELFELYLMLRPAAWAQELDEGILLSFLEIGRDIHYCASKTILEQGIEIPYVFLFLAGPPKGIGDRNTCPKFWGLQALNAPYEAPLTLVAPEQGTRALIFPISKMIAFLNEAPDLLIALLQTETAY